MTFKDYLDFINSMAEKYDLYDYDLDEDENSEITIKKKVDDENVYVCFLDSIEGKILNCKMELLTLEKTGNYKVVETKTTTKKK